MKYDFDKVWDRVDTASMKWDRQFKFGVPTGLIPFWIADTDFGTLPEAVTAIQKRLEHPLFGYTSTGKRTNETVRAWYQRRHHVDLPVEAFTVRRCRDIHLVFHQRLYRAGRSGACLYTGV